MATEVPPTFDEAARAFLEIAFIGQERDFDFDQHLQGTPKRFINMLRELTDKQEFDFTTFETASDEMVTLGPIDFHSLCAHHIIPFMGRCWVGYVPAGKIVGLSKIPRLVKYYSHDLTVQEELTTNIANRLMLELKPLGVAVIMEAEHLCMTIRGVRSPGTLTTTSCMKGVFSDHDRLARQEFLAMIGKG